MKTSALSPDLHIRLVLALACALLLVTILVAGVHAAPADAPAAQFAQCWDYGDGITVCQNPYWRHFSASSSYHGGPFTRGVVGESNTIYRFDDQCALVPSGYQAAWQYAGYPGSETYCKY